MEVCACREQPNQSNHLGFAPTGKMGLNATPPSDPPSSSNPSSLKHYYIAVDRIQFKTECCASSDPCLLCSLAAHGTSLVYSTISNLPRVSLYCLYSDLSDLERIKVLENFRRLTAERNQKFEESSERLDEGQEENKWHVLVLTDVCLPLVNLGELPLTARILINWQLPAKKETYMRRISTCMVASDGIILNMVVGGEVVTLKSLEESTGLLIDGMTIYDQTF